MLSSLLWLLRLLRRFDLIDVSSLPLLVVPTGTLVCIVALLATVMTRHVLMLLNKTLLVDLSFVANGCIIALLFTTFL